MFPEELLTQPVTVRVPASTDVVFGEMQTTYDDVETTMYLESRSTSEELPNRNTPVTDWRGFGKADVPFASTCLVIYGDHTLEMNGDPQWKWDPFDGRWSHVEMDLREVDRDADDAS